MAPLCLVERKRLGAAVRENRHGAPGQVDLEYQAQFEPILLGIHQKRSPEFRFLFLFQFSKQPIPQTFVRHVARAQDTRVQFHNRAFLYWGLSVGST
jgi:hypothetical protein